MSSTAPVLELREISKSFGAVDALQRVDLKAVAGQTHAIVGDNGAGKSTIVKVITGIHQRDGGELLVNGALQNAAGDVAVVYQDLALVECLDIATNMALGSLPRRFGLLDRRRMDREAREVLRDLNVRVGDVTTPVGLLSGGQRQVVAIARAVRMKRPVMLLDEPTAALGVRETVQVGGIIDEVRGTGTAVVLVSHDLEFVFEHADVVTVLRLGNTVGTRQVAEITRDELISMITGLNNGSRPQDPGRTSAQESDPTADRESGT